MAAFFAQHTQEVQSMKGHSPRRILEESADFSNNDGNKMINYRFMSILTVKASKR